MIFNDYYQHQQLHSARSHSFKRKPRWINVEICRNHTDEMMVCNNEHMKLIIIHSDGLLGRHTT